MSENTENPFAKPTDAPQAASPEDLAIIGTILDLDELMSADAPRAERVVMIYTRSDLQAAIDTDEAELETLIDDDGKVGRDSDATLGDAQDGRALFLARRIQDNRQAYAASGRQVRIRQLSGDDWTAFTKRHEKTLDKGAPFPDSMWNELISESAIAPKMTVDQVARTRAKLGAPTLALLASACFDINTRVGTSVPKSSLSSHVLKLQEPSAS